MQPVVIGDVMWEPSPEVISKSRLKRFMVQHGIETFAELLKRADDDIEWFWDAAIKDIDIAFYRPYDKVVDMSKGKPWATWWIGGRMNIVQSCLDRYRNTESRDKLAIIWEGEPGEVRKLTYRELDPEDPLMIIYTSGTTGKPKGCLHVHGGFPVKTAQDMAHGFDIGADDTVFWYTDIGWMMGPWLIFGSLILGATMVLYEGTPDYPAADRLWRMVADHGVTVLGVSPTLV
ncbi:MAG TPA: AMP-binding protein, partial [Candidatus Dormibacteraeota bacterium]